MLLKKNSQNAPRATLRVINLVNIRTWLSEHHWDPQGDGGEGGGEGDPVCVITREDEYN